MCKSYYNMIVCQLVIEVPDILGLRARLRTMKIKVYFLNSIISIFLITLIIPGVVSCIASASDGDYNSSSNSSEITYNESEEFDYSNSEEFNFSNSEEFNYSNSEEFNYSNYEEYLTDDQNYTYYDSSISDLDVVRDSIGWVLTSLNQKPIYIPKSLSSEILWVAILLDLILWKTPHQLHILNLIR
jgi:hypothetical protein